ncbi:chemotaxis protein CheX [Vallitalea guaymasensis]|uniref:Chemotaxis protein CheX n=1 Tax=Vallitalea guaymasensis TaxID=1185412 RepID=A0A8J8MBD5_9FIRM|nr:chemotaxis protein CheX [Vallitalea guaymasensis]QUH29683.1 chemotaxis protein CheX [Vallitalea guaymasensis]
MSVINVEYINPFIGAAQKILKDVCQLETKLQKPYLKDAEYEGDLLAVIIGVTGNIKGQVILSLNISTACNIASKMMMGMPVEELNNMAKSAISELSNMILGNAATALSQKGLTVDITPPSICLGKDMNIMVNHSKNICVPLKFSDDSLFEINISIVEE